MAGVVQSIIFLYIIALHGLLIFKLQENSPTKTEITKNALVAKEGEIEKCYNELNDSKITCNKKLEKSSKQIESEKEKVSQKIRVFTEAANTCKAELEAEQTNFKSVQNKLSEAEKQQLNINKTYESEVSKLTKTFEGQVSQQKNRIQEIGKDRKDKVIKLADQLTNLRGQLDELVDHIESQHQEINEVHHFDD